METTSEKLGAIDAEIDKLDKQNDKDIEQIRKSIGELKDILKELTDDDKKRFFKDISALEAELSDLGEEGKLNTNIYTPKNIESEPDNSEDLEDLTERVQKIQNKHPRLSAKLIKRTMSFIKEKNIDLDSENLDEGAKNTLIKSFMWGPIAQDIADELSQGASISQSGAENVDYIRGGNMGPYIDEINQIMDEMLQEKDQTNPENKNNTSIPETNAEENNEDLNNFPSAQVDRVKLKPENQTNPEINTDNLVKDKIKTNKNSIVETDNLIRITPEEGPYVGKMHISKNKNYTVPGTNDFSKPEDISENIDRMNSLLASNVQPAESDILHMEGDIIKLKKDIENIPINNETKKNILEVGNLLGEVELRKIKLINIDLDNGIMQLKVGKKPENLITNDFLNKIDTSIKNIEATQDNISPEIREDIAEELKMIPIKISSLPLETYEPELKERVQEVNKNIINLIPQISSGYLPEGDFSGTVEGTKAVSTYKNLDVMNALGVQVDELIDTIGPIMLPEIIVERKGYNLDPVTLQIKNILQTIEENLPNLSRDEQIIFQKIKDDMNKMAGKKLDILSEDGIQDAEFIMRDLDLLKDFLPEDQKQKIKTLIQDNEQQIEKAKDELKKMEAKQSLLKLEAEKQDLLAKEEKAREEARANPLEKLTSIRTKFLENKNEIDESMKLHPEKFTKDEKEHMETMKPLIAALNISNFEDELATIEEENKGNWTKEDLDKMLKKLTSILNDVNDLYTLTADNNEYKKNLKEAIDRLEAKQSLLKLEDEKLDFLAREEQAREEARANPLEKLTSIRTKFLENKNEIDESMKLHPEKFTKEEKERIENMKPLTAALDVSNFEDELATIEEENKGNRAKEDLDKMLGKLVSLLNDANNLYNLTPESNPYKKNLRDAIDRLKAKQSLLTSEDQKLDMLAREEQAREEGKKRFADFKEMPIIEEERTMPIEYGRLLPQDLINKEKELLKEKEELEEKQKENEGEQKELENKQKESEKKRTDILSNLEEMPSVEEEKKTPIEYGKVIPQDLINKANEILNKEVPKQVIVKKEIPKKETIPTTNTALQSLAEDQKNSLKDIFPVKLKLQEQPTSNDNIVNSLLDETKKIKENLKNKYNMEVNINKSNNAKVEVTWLVTTPEGKRHTLRYISNTSYDPNTGIRNKRGFDGSEVYYINDNPGTKTNHTFDGELDEIAKEINVDAQALKSDAKAVLDNYDNQLSEYNTHMKEGFDIYKGIWNMYGDKSDIYGKYRNFSPEKIKQATPDEKIDTNTKINIAKKDFTEASNAGKKFWKTFQDDTKNKIDPLNDLAINTTEVKDEDDIIKLLETYIIDGQKNLGKKQYAAAKDDYIKIMNILSQIDTSKGDENFKKAVAKNIEQTKAILQNIDKEIHENMIVKQEPMVKQEAKKEVVKQEPVKKELPKEEVKLEIITNKNIQPYMTDILTADETKSLDTYYKGRENQYDKKYSDGIIHIISQKQEALEGEYKTNPTNEIKENIDILEREKHLVELRLDTEKEIVIWFKRYELLGEKARPMYSNIANFLVRTYINEPDVYYDKFCTYNGEDIREITLGYAMQTIKDIEKGKKLGKGYVDNITKITIPEGYIVKNYPNQKISSKVIEEVKTSYGSDEGKKEIIRRLQGGKVSNSLTANK